MNKRQQLWMWKQRQSTAGDSLKPSFCAVVYLVCCCSSHVLPQVSSASPVARAPSLSCLSQQCVRFMFFVVGFLFCRGLWRHVWHAFYCSGGSYVVQYVMRGSEFVFFGCEFGGLALKRWTCNNVMSRIFADGRQGGCLRLDMEMASGLISMHAIHTHTYTLTHARSWPASSRLVGLFLGKTKHVLWIEWNITSSIQTGH